MQEALLDIEHNAGFIIKRLWYWVFGGVVECAKIALDAKHWIASEFTVTSSLLITSIWLFMPFDFMLPLAFTRVIEAVMPVWVFALIYMIVARTAMHCALKSNAIVRENMMFAVAGAWGSMLFMNLLSASLGVGTLFLLYMTGLSLYLQFKMGIRNRQRDADAEQ